MDHRGVDGAYLVILAVNLPFRVFVVNAACLAAIFAAVFALPTLSWWWYVPAILVFHRIQVWSHMIYTRALDMTDWNKKYPKGFALFVLLSVYELPILLNYCVLWQSRLVLRGKRNRPDEGNGSVVLAAQPRSVPPQTPR